MQGKDRAGEKKRGLDGAWTVVKYWAVARIALERKVLKNRIRREDWKGRMGGCADSEIVGGIDELLAGESGWRNGAHCTSDLMLLIETT